MVDIKDYLEDKFEQVIPATYPLVRIDCQFCIDNRARLYISPIDGDKPKGWMYCHNEQKKYDFAELYSMLEDLSFKQANEMVYGAETEPTYGKIDSFSLNLNESLLIQEELIQPIELPPFYIPLHGLTKAKFDSLVNPYLVNRRVTQELCEEYKLGYSRDNVGLWGNRLIIPIFQENVLVAYQGRAMYLCKEKKYIFNNGAKIGNYLFNLDNVDENETSIFLVEGVFDVWALREAGFTNVCASFGKHLTDKCLDIITNRFRYLYILWDSDAKVEISLLADSLRDKMRLYICDIPGKDLDELPVSKRIEVIKNTERYSKESKMDAYMQF